jgi:putative FmdB family regulatory protein
MPTYTYKCNRCEHVSEKVLKLSEHQKVFKEGCGNCGLEGTCDGDLVQIHLTAPGFEVKGMQSSGSKKRSSVATGKDVASVPINIIDEKPDGGYKVTRIGKKGDIDGE